MMKKLNRILLLSLLFCWSTQLSFGQFMISGTVTDSEGEPLIGVTLVEESSNRGAATDGEGKYQLELTRSDATVTVTYIGYETQRVSVNNRQTIDITLSTAMVGIDEVVVTGLGIKRQKRELGYSTEKFDGDEIVKSTAPNLVNALSGKSAGVNIANANGVDGGTTRITIRGNNNIKGNNQPLIIVDGVPLENNPGLTDIGRGADWGSAINLINPEDIEDLNILKGPTAAAKYGTRGANGVILITTKRGNKRKGLGIQYSLTHKVISPYRYREVQNIYGAGGPINLLDPAFNTNGDGEFVYPADVHSSNGPFGRPTTEQFGFYSTGMSWGPKMEGQMVRWWDGELRSFDPQPDNLQQFFSNGSTTTHNISFSGGNERSTMRVSMTAQNHTAVVPNSDFQQYTANLGGNLEIHKNLIADVAISYINFNRKNSPSLGDDNNSSFGKGILYSWPRSYKGLEETLNFNEDGTQYDYNGRYPFTFTPQHLWWNTWHQNTFLSRNKLIGSLGLAFTPFSWLSITGRTGLDFNLNQFEERFDPVDATGVNGARYSNELVRDRVVNNEFLVTAFKDNVFNSPFGVKVSFGGAQWGRSQYGIKAVAQNWQNPWLFTFNNFRNPDQNNLPSEIRFDKKINSFYGFINLSYERFLFLELSGRNDWSSALPLESNSYFYPSASLSYILTESFQLPFKWLSFWKLRASFAQTATDTDPFLLDFIYNTGTFANQQTATLPGVKPPVGLRPQIANSYELGTTIGLFDDKINLDFTYYYIRSFDQILDSPVPSSSGVGQVRINSGVLENYGFELGLKATVLQRKDWLVEMGINISRNRNFVLSLGEGANTLELANIWGLFGPNISVQEGQNYGTIYGYDYVYHEETGQPILNDEGTHYLISENLVPVGDASPDFMGGWTMRARYKRFSLNTLVDAKIGGDIYAGSYVIGLQTGQSPETLVERMGNGLPYEDPDGNVRNIGVVLPGVYADGRTNDQVVHYYYKYLPNAGGWGQLLTSPGILDNTWIKMREISLSYDVPNTLFGKQPLFQSLQVSLVGRDLFYWYTSLPDRINPEGTNGAGNAQGLEWASLPGIRSFSIRLSLGL
ncbi:MAG: SusC/RagA family TonB-linked outer membrane protein [Bacteroidota bacterium]